MDSDLSQPVQLGTIGVKQLLKCYQAATEDVRQTLLHECDVILECRVCHSLYRGIPNFLAHKRKYCEGLYSGSLVRFQQMTYKEDETMIIASGSSSSLQEQNSLTDSVMYENIKRVGEAIDNVRSTDHVLKLDVILENKNAMIQNLTCAAGVSPAHGICREKKPKVEKIDRSSSPQKYTEGIMPIPSSDRVHSFKDFFHAHKLANVNTNSCLKCSSVAATYKGLKSHMKNHHIKRRIYCECLMCCKVFPHESILVKHLMSVHSEQHNAASKRASASKSEKFVVDGKAVYNIPKISRLPDFDKAKKGIDRSISSFDTSCEDPNEPETISFDENLTSDARGPDSNASGNFQSESDDQQGRVEYLSTKSFGVKLMQCLNIFDLSGKPRRYKCKIHPEIRFATYSELKDHMLKIHCLSVMRCPVCAMKFKTYNFSRLVKHLRLGHSITEDNIYTLKAQLPQCILAKEANAEDPEIELEDNQDSNYDHPKGATLYPCCKCNRMLTTAKRLHYHLTSAHQLSLSAIKALKQKTVFQPHRETLRKRSRQFDIGLASTFNLEDYFCPLCHKNYPSMSSVSSHVKARHGLEGEELQKVRNQIREHFEKQKVEYGRTIMNLSAARSARYNANRVACREDTNAEGEIKQQGCDDVEVPTKRRKQMSPVKANGHGDIGLAVQQLASQQLSLTCGFCARVFGKKAALVQHERVCIKKHDVMESHEDESVEKMLTCNVCSRSFEKKCAHIQHEKTCKKVEQTEDVNHDKQDEAYIQNTEGMKRRNADTLSPQKEKNKTDPPPEQTIPNPRKIMFSPSSFGMKLEVVELLSKDQAANWEEQETKESKDSSSFFKVYKCPLCDEEDLELHNINNHLVDMHHWSRAKVAGRMDTLKRSIIYKKYSNQKGLCKLSESELSDGVESSPPSSVAIMIPDKEPHSVAKEVTPSNASDLSMRAKGDFDSLAEKVDQRRDLSTFSLEDYFCPLCPKSFFELWQLCSHWQMRHGLDKAGVLRLKKEVLEDKKKKLSELRISRTRKSTSDTKESVKYGYKIDELDS